MKFRANTQTCRWDVKTLATGQAGGQLAKERLCTDGSEVLVNHKLKMSQKCSLAVKAGSCLLASKSAASRAGNKDSFPVFGTCEAVLGVLLSMELPRTGKKFTYWCKSGGGA